MTPTPTPPIERWATAYFGLRWNVIQRFLLATLLPLTIVWYVDPTAPTMADARLYDRVLATFPSAAESNVVIVAIDNESIQKIGPWPWPEAVHTKFLQQLDLQSPKAVVLNFMLGAPAHSGDDDAALAAALRVLPVYLSVRNDPSAAFAGEIASGLVQTRRFAPMVQGIGHLTLATEGASERVRLVRLLPTPRTRYCRMRVHWSTRRPHDPRQPFARFDAQHARCTLPARTVRCWCRRPMST